MADIGKPVRKIKIEPERRREPVRPERAEPQPKKEPTKAPARST